MGVGASTNIKSLEDRESTMTAASLPHGVNTLQK